MEMIQWVSKIVVCIFEVYMIYDLFSFFFNPRFNSRMIRVYGVVILGISIMGINYFELLLLNFFGGILLVLIFGKIIFKASLGMCFGYGVLFYIISGCSEVVGEFLYNIVYHTGSLTNAGVSSNYFIFIGKTITFIILKSIQFLSKKYKSKMGGEMLKGFMILPVATLLILYGIIIFDFYEDMFQVQRIVLGTGCILLLFANAFVYHILERFSETIRRSIELDVMNAKAVMESKHYISLEEINKEHLDYIHDMDKNLRAIARLIEDNQSNKVLEILDKLNIQILNIQNKKYCSDKILNGILKDRTSIAAEQDINFEVIVPNTINMDRIDDLDKISMIGNLLDNAFEAVVKCDNEKVVRFEISHGNQDYLTIKIVNTFKEEPTKLGDGYITDKQDKRNHGVGIKRVRKLTEKYGGMFESKIDENMFVTELYLSTSDPE